MRTFRTASLAIIVSLSAFAMTGCGGGATPVAGEASPGLVPSPTSSPQVTVTVTETATPTVTPTPTASPSTTVTPRPTRTATAAPGVGDYGSDPVLDALWDSCEKGDNAACDDLYMDSPVASGYEAYGDQCAGRGRTEDWCVNIADAFKYGDHPVLDRLYESCTTGDDESCDELFLKSAIDSEYESYGDDCAGRGRDKMWCSDKYNDEIGLGEADETA